ncbi:MAG: peptide MFS transporter [Acidobacteriota bacterium]
MQDPHAALAGDRAFFGHPRGLATLFFTEMWERFSYYGMRALLILFMTTAAAEGGLGFDPATAGAIYGLYTAGVYLLALPGGWLADRLIGQQRAVLIGGLLIACGHFTLAFPGLVTFYAGLVLIVLGTGLLKPNISTIVGQLYASADERRDAGFSIFYMGINVGGFLAPLVCGYLGESIDWHLGFAAAGVGMVLGLLQYVAGQSHLGQAGKPAPSGLSTAREAERRRRIYSWLGVGALGAGGLALLLAFGILPINVVQLANAAIVVIASFAILFFVYLYSAGGLSPVEKRQLGAIALLFVFSWIFWAGFEQGGSSFNLFARDMTDRVIGGWEFPASWFQFVNSAFIILLVPVFAALWLRLGPRQPAVPVKFALGLIFLGAGFAVLTWGARIAADGTRVGLSWLVVVYLLHTCGELCLSPVGLSTVSRLAPQRFTGQMMGVWFLSISLGNLTAGQLAGQTATFSMAQIFFWVFVVSCVAGVGLLFFRKKVRGLIKPGEPTETGEVEGTGAVLRARSSAARS